jgi:hypothetical protein
MKKIQQELKIYKDIYVSVDGKEFKTEEECKAWENSYKGTLAASFAEIKKVEAYSPSLGLPYSNDDQECYVIKPKDLNEITLINAYIQSSTYDGSGQRLTAKYIGKLVVLNFGYDHDYCEVYLLEDYIQSITNYITKLENELSEEETTNNN